MKKIKSFLTVIISISLVLSTTVFSYADEGRFVAIDVVEYDEHGDKTVETHSFYTDGNHLYASIDTLDRYTFYDYDEQYTAFVRAGQDYRFSFSKTTLDFENKKATVKMINGEKEYKLHDVIKYGDEYYLPLDQMCGFLMASTDFSDNKLAIRNSGFSISDAAYNFNNYSYVFDYNDIVDGIFAGDEGLYFGYCIIGYFGSTIFGLRIKNLDVFTKSGDTEYYQEFLENCITDYDEYLKTQADGKSFKSCIEDGLDLAEGMKGVLEIASRATTVSKTAYDLYQSANGINTFGELTYEELVKLDIEYIEAYQWSEVLGKLSKSLDYMEYFVKAISMTEDHKLMIRECNEDLADRKADSSLKTAIINNFHQFGANAFTTVLSKIAETLIEKVPQKVIKKFGAEIIPHIAVIKAVNLAFKLLGYDLSDNSQYSIMLQSSANSYLSGRYSVLMNEAGKTKESSEKFRRAAIFALLASKNAFEAGNALDKKLESSGTLFNDELDVVCARLNLFYRAAESSCYENIDSIDNVIKKNQKTVSESGIIGISTAIGSPADIKPIIQLTNDNARKLLEDAVQCYVSCCVNGWYGIVYDYDKLPIHCPNEDNPNYMNIQSMMENEYGEPLEDKYGNFIMVDDTEDYLITNYNSKEEIKEYIDRYLTDGMEDWPKELLDEEFEYGLYHETGGKLYFCPHLEGGMGYIGYDLSSIDVVEKVSNTEYVILIDQYSSAGYYDCTDRMVVKNINGTFKISMVIGGEYGDQHYKSYISSDYEPLNDNWAG